jgi:hypothetical protein
MVFKHLKKHALGLDRPGLAPLMTVQCNIYTSLGKVYPLQAPLRLK